MYQREEVGFEVENRNRAVNNPMINNMSQSKFNP
jgi:hypothetical protein